MLLLLKLTVNRPEPKMIIIRKMSGLLTLQAQRWFLLAFQCKLNHGTVYANYIFTTSAVYRLHVGLQIYIQDVHMQPI